VIGSKQVLPADTEVMRKAGKIDGRLSRNGEKIGQGDVVIGATALLHDERVLTRNLDEFERIPDLEVEAY
jgi:tRNA(fMet)-specific endonuclease VapC